MDKGEDPEEWTDDYTQITNKDRDNHSASFEIWKTEPRIQIEKEELSSTGYRSLGHLVTKFKDNDGEIRTFHGTASLYVKFTDKVFAIITCGHNFYQYDFQYLESSFFL